MRLGSFHHPVMHWSMYDETAADLEEQRIKQEGRWHDDYLESPEGRERCRRAPLQQEMELEAQGAPDGIHEFVIGRRGEESPTLQGILVQDGKFLPHPTASAIYLAQVQLEGKEITNWGRRVMWVHHRFIEEITWEGDRFRVIMGS